MLEELVEFPIPDTKATRVLVVDDDPDDYYLVREMLRRSKGVSHVAKHASNLEGAVKLLVGDSFDVVLLDLNLGDSHGLSTLRSLIKTCANTPIIVLTGIDSDSLGREAIKVGAEDYVPKNLADPMLLTRSISYAIERHRLLLEIRRKAEQDPLTEMLNRSALYARLETLIQQSDRNSAKLAVVMMDLDEFKAINDTYGHQVGDELLVTVSDRIRQNLRRSDVAARFGGDEFVLVLTNFRCESELEEIVQRKLERLSAPYSLLIDGKQQVVNVGVSMGVCVWHRNMVSGELLTAADGAMYQSKHNGKNQISFSC